MAAVDVEQLFTSPQETVFQLATDFPRAVEYNPRVASVRMHTDGPPGVGTRFLQMHRMERSGNATPMEAEVVAFEPPYGFVLKFPSPIMTAYAEYVLTPRGKDTHVACRLRLEPTNFVGRVLAWFLGGAMRDAVRQRLQEHLSQMAAWIERHDGDDDPCPTAHDDQ